MGSFVTTAQHGSSRPVTTGVICTDSSGLLGCDRIGDRCYIAAFSGLVPIPLVPNGLLCAGPGLSRVLSDLDRSTPRGCGVVIIRAQSLAGALNTKT